MECKTVNERLTLCECLLDTTAEISFDAEPALPDYCQDIGKVLRCRAVPVLNVREAGSGSIRLEGVIKLHCLYADGRDKALRCFSHELPFAADVPAPRLADADRGENGQNVYVSAEVRPTYVNCRALSQRKLDIHGALAARVRAEMCAPVELMSSAEGAGVRVRTNKVTVSRFVTRRCAEFTVSETFELGQGKPPALSVVRGDAFVVMTECKPIANKLMLKGELSLEVVYDTSAPGAIESMEFSIPFSQFIDLTGAEDTSDIDISLSVGDTVLSLRADADGEQRMIAADIRIIADAAAFSESEVPVLTDAYSVDYELELQRRRLTAEHLAARADGACTASCRLETHNEIEKVLDCWCEINSVSAECTGSAAAVRGTAAGCAVVRLADGDLEYLEAPMEFNSETALPGECGCGRCTAQAAPRGCVCNIAAANRLELRADIDTVATLREDVSINAVSSITPDTSRPKRSGELPGAVLYFGEAGEDLWTIARATSARAEDIAAGNAIEGDTLTQDKLLLIVLSNVSQ